jgi:hypothetical protein
MATIYEILQSKRFEKEYRLFSESKRKYSKLLRGEMRVYGGFAIMRRFGLM